MFVPRPLRQGYACCPIYLKMATSCLGSRIQSLGIGVALTDIGVRLAAWVDVPGPDELAEGIGSCV
jgi:hypothetical protein